MPYRAMNVVVGVVGVVVLVGLVILGADAYQAARTGSGWRRRLVTAGLILLASLGLMSCEGKAKTEGEGQVAVQTGVEAPLEETAEWKAIQSAWEYVGPLAKSGESTTAERRGADERLNAAKAATEKLAASGLLSGAEAGLLTSEAASLREDLYRNPPTDSRVLCYRMAYLPPAQKSMRRLSERLPLLQQMVEEGRGDLPVLRKVVPTIESDLTTLTDEKELAKLQPKEREEAQRLRPDVEKTLATIKQQLEEKK